MNDKYKEILDKAMSEGTVDPLVNFSKAMQSVTVEMVKDFPMWMRFNYILNSITNIEATNINWKLIDEILKDNVNKYDYNAYDTINTIESLNSAKVNCIAASLGVGVWYKSVCKECGETFYMTKGEIDFFEKKDFNLPKRCKNCRDGEPKIKKPIQNNKPINAVTDGKTEMQIAMEKAGLMAI